ncbi:MAG: hypothetical protein JOZ01_05530, partial [Candidatus Eremiobacteraeota bacterium]|nr:hypothetical protein [Candidatus Eremiobacteraeota bacterium]
MEVQRKKRDTKTIGDRSEIETMAALNRAGYAVFVPFGENHRYDLVADKDGALLRIQVKTGRLRNGAIQFGCWSTHAHKNGFSSRTYVGEVDYIAVYCPDVDRVFMVPIEDTRTWGTLRWLPAKNRQSRRVRWAFPYMLEESSQRVGRTPIAAVSTPKTLALP